MLSTFAPAEEAISFTTIVMRQTLGESKLDWRYQSNKGVTRLEALVAKDTPFRPWNLIDHASGDITVVRPHNRSVVRLPANAFDAPPAAPPDLKADFSEPVFPMSEAPGSVFPSTGPGSLVAHPETRDILGYPCTRHSLRVDARYEVELWLTDSPKFPPFFLLLWGLPSRHGPREPHVEWPRILRQQQKFPLLAILRVAPLARPGLPPPRSYEESRWEVISIEPSTPDSSLFSVPEGYEMSHSFSEKPSNPPELP